MSGLNKWTSAGLVAVGAGALVGAYALFFHGTPAVADNQLSKPYVVVATPAPGLSNGVAVSTCPAPRTAVPALAGNQPGWTVVSRAGLSAEGTTAAQALSRVCDDIETAEPADDADGIEPASVLGHSAQVAVETPAAGWMRRLDVARELLRQGAVETGRRSLERIIGDAGVCRAYQYALIDLAAVELQRGQAASAQQLLEEASGSNQALALDDFTRNRLVNLQAKLQARALAAAEAEAVDLE